MNLNFPNAQQKNHTATSMSKSVDLDEASSSVDILRKKSLSYSNRMTSNTFSNDSSSDQPAEVNKQSLATSVTHNSTSLVNATSVLFSVCLEDGPADAPLLPEEFAQKLVAQVHRRLDVFLTDSPYIRTNTQLHSLPRFSPVHLNLGKTLAKGGFSNIIELNSFNKEDCVLRPVSSEDDEDYCGSTRVQRGEYVIKCLSNKLSLKKLPGATKDIVFEAHTLAALNHENIVTLRGWSQDGIEGFQTAGRADAFFLILDRLGETLFQRIFEWQSELEGSGKYRNLKKKVNYGTIFRHQFHEKIQVTVDVASALAYCHSKRIIHRDIKSANVAFDRDGRAKLIDFGLAIEIAPQVPNDPHRTFELTGNIGTARYMSPEVILEKQYNEKSDVHSFAILCWEACAAKKPYASLDAKHVKEHVSKWNERPSPYWSWPRRLRKIMKQGWAKRQEDRPTMVEFHQALLKVRASLPRSSIDFSETK